MTQSQLPDQDEAAEALSPRRATSLLHRAAAQGGADVGTSTAREAIQEAALRAPELPSPRRSLRGKMPTRKLG